MDKKTKKSIKRSIKFYDDLVYRVKTLAKDNPDFNLDGFVNHLKGRRDTIASQIGKTRKK